MARSSPSTYVLLEVPEDVWTSIYEKLQQAGYEHAFHEQQDGRVAIDMHGIALVKGQTPTRRKGLAIAEERAEQQQD